MARSLGRPTPVAAGRVIHARSGAEVTIEGGAENMVHRLTERGFSAEYTISWQIGAGLLAHSYIVNTRGYLFESPVTWFRTSGWDVSPGYAAAPTIDFDRPITATCLFCHAGDVPFADSDGRKPAALALNPIGCERCHGPAERHVRHPTAGNIVNPRKLQPRARDSICEQCHLEGDNRILNPGKRWSDFLPGDELEKTMVAYVLEEQGQEPKAVGQVEQLAESRCATQSRGKLWCGTCHNPHGAQTDRNAAVLAVCRSCHSTLSEPAHPRGQVECVSCHMPRRASEYAHVAVTDHRIVRQAAKMPQSRLRGTQSLKAWIEPPLSLRRRDLALANLRAGVKLHMPELVRSGLKLMTDQEADSDLLAAACEATHDVALCRRSARADPRSAERAMALGSALAATGELDGAETELIRAIDLDPSLKHAYLELWTVYDRQHKSDRMKATAERFLVWNPSNILFRLLLRNLLNTDLF